MSLSSFIIHSEAIDFANIRTWLMCIFRHFSIKIFKIIYQCFSSNWSSSALIQLESGAKIWWLNRFSLPISRLTFIILSEYKSMSDWICDISLNIIYMLLRFLRPGWVHDTNSSLPLVFPLFSLFLQHPVYLLLIPTSPLISCQVYKDRHTM